MVLRPVNLWEWVKIMENFFTTNPAQLLRTIHTLRFLDTTESHKIADDLLTHINRAIMHVSENNSDR